DLHKGRRASTRDLGRLPPGDNQLGVRRNDRPRQMLLARTVTWSSHSGSAKLPTSQGRGPLTDDARQATHQKSVCDGNEQIHRQDDEDEWLVVRGEHEA